MKGKMTNLAESDPVTNHQQRGAEVMRAAQDRQEIIHGLLQKLQDNVEATQQDPLLVSSLRLLVESVNSGTALFTTENRELLANIGATQEDLKHFPLSVGEDTVEVISEEKESGGNQFSPQN